MDIARDVICSNITWIERKNRGLNETSISRDALGLRRVSTEIRDRRILALRQRGFKQTAIAYKLHITVDQVKHAERRDKKRRKTDL